MIFPKPQYVLFNDGKYVRTVDDVTLISSELSAGGVTAVHRVSSLEDYRAVELLYQGESTPAAASQPAPAAPAAPKPTIFSKGDPIVDLIHVLRKTPVGKKVELAMERRKNEVEQKIKTGISAARQFVHEATKPPEEAKKD